MPEVIRSSAFTAVYRLKRAGVDVGGLGSKVAVSYTAPPVITSPLTASGNVDEPFSYTLTATGATSYSISNIPLGLSVSGDGTVLSGTPTTESTVNVTLSATGPGGTTTETLVVTIGSSIACSQANPPPERLLPHQQVATLTNSADHYQRYRLRTWTVNWQRERVEGDCVDFYTRSNVMMHEYEFELSPGQTTSLQLSEPAKFMWTIEKWKLTPTPDGGGAFEWEEQDVEGPHPNDLDGNPASKTGTSQLQPGYEPTDEPPTAPPPSSAEEGPVSVDYERPDAPSISPRPDTVNDTATLNQAQEARSADQMSGLERLSKQLEDATKALLQGNANDQRNASKSQASQDKTNEKLDGVKGSLDGLAGTLDGPGYEGNGAGEPGEGDNPGGAMGENLPGNGGGQPSDWGATDLGGKLGATAAQTAPFFVIPFGSLGIDGLEDVPVDFASQRFQDWVQGARGMMLALVALVMLYNAVDIVLNK